jgi:anthranilate 1,2-dioxygenase small subunit
LPGFFFSRPNGNALAMDPETEAFKMANEISTGRVNANEYNPHYDRHLLGRSRVTERDNGTWQVDAPFAVYQTTLEGQSKLFSVGRYCDRVRMDGKRLRFVEKKVIVDTFDVPTLLATPL